MQFLDGLTAGGGASVFTTQDGVDPEIPALGNVPTPIPPRGRSHVSLLDGLFDGGGGGGSSLHAPVDPDDDGQPAYGLHGDLAYLTGGAAGDVLAKDPSSGLPVWSPRAGITINSFTQSTVSSGLARVGHTYASIAFTATYNVTPTTATNNDGIGHTDYVHLTPTSFSAVHSYAFATPATSFTWTLTAGIAGSPDATRTVTISAGNDSMHGYADTSASMDQTAFDAAVAAATKSLDSNIGHSFAFGTNASPSTKRATFLIPTRYGTPATIKDNVTGFAQDFVKVGSALSYPNADGYTETYDAYQLQVTNTTGFTTVIT